MLFESASVEAVQNAFPEWMAFLFAFLSYLGSVWFVAPAVILAYWLVDRHRFAPWLGIVMGGYAIMVGLKGYFTVERPGVGPTIAPESLPPVLSHLYAPAVEVGTTSFPSGHAIAGTVIWTMLVLETDLGSKRARYAAGAAMISLVGFSRIGVGLHYPIDVAVGVGIALAYLFVVLSVKRRLADRGTHTATTGVFVTVAAISLCSLLVGNRLDAAALLGGAIGSLVVWEYAPPARTGWSMTIRTVAGLLIGLSVLGAAAGLLILFESYLVWFLVGLVAGGIVLALPQFGTDGAAASTNANGSSGTIR
ncbi:phosphatase PAP2 family protein [Halostagnicola bangensis]